MSDDKYAALHEWMAGLDTDEGAIEADVTALLADLIATKSMCEELEAACIACGLASSHGTVCGAPAAAREAVKR